MAYVRVQAGIPHTNHTPQGEQRVVNHIGGTEKKGKKKKTVDLLYSTLLTELQLFSLYVHTYSPPPHTKYMALLPSAYLALLQQKGAGLPYRIWQRTKGGREGGGDCNRPSDRV